jgi:hypothetical protein
VNEITANWRTLIPFDSREAISVKEAAARAGKSERTVRNWCAKHGIGRRIADGTWGVSKVALPMLLEGRDQVLGAYLDGVRASCEPVADYYRREGLGDLLKRPEFAV